MPVQTMGLDYSWLVNLADIISRAREKPTGVQGAQARPAQGTAAPEKTRYQLEQEQRREDLLAGQTRKHEITLKQMDMESALAEAMSKERIAGVGAEAGTEQAQIGAAGQVAAAQKTTMEKGYEFIDMLMKMDEKSANELISTLEARRTEGAGQVGERPVSTISSGGRTISLPGTTEEVTGDPNDPLTWLEDIGAYTPGAGAPRPKPTGTAKNEVEEFMGMVDDMIGGDIAGMAAMLSKEGGTEKLLEKIEVLGTEAGISREVIDSVKEIYRAMAPAYEPSLDKEPGILSKAWTGAKEAVTPESPLNIAIEKELGITKTMGEYPGIPFGEARAAEKGEVGPIFESLAKGIGPEFGDTLADFMETVIMGPFYPAYKKKISKETGKSVVKEPIPTKEVGEITEQDVITEMGTWEKEKIKEFQTLAKERGLYKGPINGLHSNELDNAMKEYFKKYKEEWGETK